jgi:hypothetical protein
MAICEFLGVRQRQPPCTVYRLLDGRAPNSPLRFLDLTPKILRQSAHPGSHDDRRLARNDTDAVQDKIVTRYRLALPLVDNGNMAPTTAFAPSPKCGVLQVGYTGSKRGLQLDTDKPFVYMQASHARGDRWACNAATTCAPSPTAAAARLTEPERMSPMAKTPRRSAGRGRGSGGVDRWCAVGSSAAEMGGFSCAIYHGSPTPN